jgi:hypothetical protein
MAQDTRECGRGPGSISTEACLMKKWWSQAGSNR